MDGPWRGSKKQGGVRSGASRPSSLRLCAGHLVPALLERARHRRQILGTPRGVVGPIGALVRLDRAAVVLLRVAIDVGHVDVQVQVADVVREREQVLLGDRLTGRERLAVTAGAPPSAKEDEAEHAGADDGEDRPQRGVLGTAPAGAAAHGGDFVDEGEQRRREPVVAVLLERLGGGPRRLAALENVACRTELTTDDDGVRAAPVERLRELRDHQCRVAARLVARLARQDRDVDGTCVRVGDPFAQPVGVRLRDRGLRVGMDIDRVARQRLGGLVDDRAGQGSRGEGQREERQQEKKAGHPVRMPRRAVSESARLSSLSPWPSPR